MVLKVPCKATRIGLNERYLVFTDLMHKLIRKHGKRTTFYFFAKDVKKILGESDDPHMHVLQSKLKPLYDVGIVNPFTLRVTWNNGREEEIGTGVIKTEEYELQDQQAMNMYFYLLGRMCDDSLVTDTPPHLYDGSERGYNKVPPYVYRLFER